MFSKEVIDKIKQGGIGVIPTDTLYGLVGRADNQETVERIYQVRKRNPDKPFIILTSSQDDLKDLGIEVTSEIKEYLNKFWPGAVSVILETKKDIGYLSRGTGTLAIRIPDSVDLRNLLKQTGPLVAPSANPEDKIPAHTIEEAKNYFGEEVDFYVDGGEMVGEPSTLIKFENDKPIVLRQGRVEI